MSAARATRRVPNPEVRPGRQRDQHERREEEDEPEDVMTAFLAVGAEGRMEDHDREPDHRPSPHRGPEPLVPAEQVVAVEEFHRYQAERHRLETRDEGDRESGVEDQGQVAGALLGGGVLDRDPGEPGPEAEDHQRAVGDRHADAGGPDAELLRRLVLGHGAEDDPRNEVSEPSHHDEEGSEEDERRIEPPLSLASGLEAVNHEPPGGEEDHRDEREPEHHADQVLRGSVLGREPRFDEREEHRAGDDAEGQREGGVSPEGNPPE